MQEALLLENQVCFPIYALSRQIIQYYRPMLDELDITYPQYLVMMVLWEHDTQTVNQLGALLKLDSGTLTPLLKRLELKGLIIRKRSKADERVVNISLTPSGRAMKEMACSIPHQMLESMGLSLEEMQQLKQLAEKMLNR
ncbi:MarR family winged helix-turn-helix transcriptional regulator [Edaphocola aurantiacus]|uniref:MarR family winged helix-turn-helix transcriptional regulator n=1 Tax=Edaphocola aurantiacus TaxID=2601682 RepID=UPI001C94A7B2|nr:MarR family transcriptional regulator [Edaphocola aurantiacus]